MSLLLNIYFFMPVDNLCIKFILTKKIPYNKVKALILIIFIDIKD